MKFEIHSEERFPGRWISGYHVLLSPRYDLDIRLKHFQSKTLEVSAGVAITST